MTEAQFRRQVPDEESARQLLEHLRWSDEPVCPHCEETENISPCSGRHDGYYRCNACDKRFNVAAGTIMQHSLLPLDKWLLAAVLLSDGPATIDQMIERLGVARMTAFGAMKRIRQACGEPGGNEELETLAGRLIQCPHQPLAPSQKRREKREKRKRHRGMRLVPARA